MLIRHSGLVSALGVLVVVLLALTGRRVEFDMHWSEALPDLGETVEAIQHVDKTFGGSVLAHVVVQWPSGQSFRSKAVFQVLSEIHESLEKFSSKSPERLTWLGKPMSILTVLQGLQGERDSLASRIPYVEKNAAERLQRLVNNESRQLLISIPIPEVGARTLLPIFEEIDADLAQVIEKHPGFSAHLTGSTVLSARNLHEIIHELVQSLVLAGGVVFVVLCIAFRSLRLGLISVIPNFFPLVVVVAALAIVGIPMQVTAALTLCLSLGIAVDDTIHLVTRFRRLQDQLGNVEMACLQAYQSVGSVIVITTIILLCGFATMMLSVSPAIRLFGQLACVALAAALVGDLIFLPALLVRWTRRK